MICTGGTNGVFTLVPRAFHFAAMEEKQISVAEARRQGGVHPLPDGQWVMDQIVKYYDTDDTYKVTWAPVIDEGPKSESDIVGQFALNEIPMFLIFYPASRLPSADVCAIAKEEFHRRHPRAKNGLLYVCWVCQDWLNSAELRKHFELEHPDESTAAGIRKRSIGPTFKFLTLAHPFLAWFTGEMRTDVQAVLSPFVHPQLGTSTTTRAPFDVIVSVLINTWDDELVVNVNPQTGLPLFQSVFNPDIHALRLLYSISTCIHAAAQLSIPHRHDCWGVEDPGRPGSCLWRQLMASPQCTGQGWSRSDQRMHSVWSIPSCQSMRDR